MKENITKEIELPESVTAQLGEGALLNVKGPKGEVNRVFLHSKISIVIENGKIVLKVSNGTKREKSAICSMTTHAKNMVSGVQENHIYKLKICSGHFPMNVAINNGEVVIKNFLGEAVPRKVSILPGADVKIDGDNITVTSPDKELAGQMAARIEKLCVITNRDKRIFQDGCYITHKAGTDI